MFEVIRSVFLYEWCLCMLSYYLLNCNEVICVVVAKRSIVLRSFEL